MCGVRGERLGFHSPLAMLNANFSRMLAAASILISPLLALINARSLLQPSGSNMTSSNVLLFILSALAIMRPTNAACGTACVAGNNG